MLSLEQIKQYYPENLAGFERFMIREYLQFKILEILFESNYANKFAFIGGTALRIVHGNNRFSEDLDFDNFKITEEDFSKVAEVIKYGLQLEGYKVEIRIASKAAYHCYIRFPKLLFDNKLSGHAEEKIFIRLDTEAQHFDFIPERIVLNRFDVFTEIIVTPIDILLAQKFLTILERKQSKGRDFFDVVFMLGKGIFPNYDFLTQKASIENGDQLREKILNKTSTMDMNKIAEDVKPFLIDQKDMKKMIMFRDYFGQAEL